MNIQCMDNSGFEDFLTRGRTYRVQAIGENGYQVLTDKGEGRFEWFGECKFRVLPG